MKNPVLEAYVTKADGSAVRVKVFNDELSSKLEKIGFVYDAELCEFSVKTNSDSEKGVIFSQLRDLGVFFSSGKEWSPSEVFEYLRELGLIDGGYQRVSWINPTEFYVTVG